MREIFDTSALERYLDQYKIRELFETKELPFHLCQYDKGEMIHFATGADQRLHFVVKGSVQIYSLHEDDERYPLCFIHDFTPLRDMEFCDAPSASLLVEVVKKDHIKHCFGLQWGGSIVCLIAGLHLLLRGEGGRPLCARPGLDQALPAVRVRAAQFGINETAPGCRFSLFRVPFLRVYTRFSLPQTHS